jgi:hypothetical protein
MDAAVKLENDTETFEHERVSSELKKQIQSARLAKKLTQAQASSRGLAGWAGQGRAGLWCRLCAFQCRHVLPLWRSVPHCCTIAGAACEAALHPLMLSSRKVFAAGKAEVLAPTVSA